MSEDTAKAESGAESGAESANEESRNAWQEFMRRQESAFDHASKALRGLFPDATVEHWNKALDEFGQGWRALMESVSEKANVKVNLRGKKGAADDEGQRPSTTGKKKVKIDVE